MATELTQGTVEYVLVDLEDKAGEIAELTGTNPRFDVVSNAGAIKYTQQPAVIDPLIPMRVRCLIDTTNGGLWATGPYKLYISLDTLPEIPRLGPFNFSVIS